VNFENSIQELRHIRRLLEIERIEEIRLYKELLQLTSLEARIKRGQSWYPAQLVGYDFISGGQVILILESTNQTEVPNTFQNGQPVLLFQQDSLATSPTERIQVLVQRQGKQRNQLRIAISEDQMPEWVEDGKLGIDPYLDETGYRRMDEALEEVIAARGSRLAELREILLGYRQPAFRLETTIQANKYANLNPSQLQALRIVAGSRDCAFIHGPPGTGKTTTLVQAIIMTLHTERQVLVCAPSNTAVDLLVEKLVQFGIKALRIGHPIRVNQHLQSYTLDEQIVLHPYYADVKRMRRQAEELMEDQEKGRRFFSKAVREKLKQERAEAFDLQKDARRVEQYIIEDILSKSQAIIATPVGISGAVFKEKRFTTVFIDEATQALEPASWIAISRANRVIFAGDPFQLPPTVKSREAEKAGLAESLPEKFYHRIPPHHHEKVTALLETQYRMRYEIMEFSNQQFYQGRLSADKSVIAHELLPGSSDPEINLPLVFVDTAGCGFEELFNVETQSLSNFGEANLLATVLEQLVEKIGYQLSASPEMMCRMPLSLGIISPYKDQVSRLRRIADDRNWQCEWEKVIELTINTIDGFQGQERDIIALSLVRNNTEKVIGFLADTRRMNVALTRARKKLIVVGDSATIGSHPFYLHWLRYVDKLGNYQSAWDYGTIEQFLA
jgi:superfamily I DNA and/or RNA helicase